MKLRSFAFTFACIAIATSAEARSIWFGPSIAFPIPAADVGESQLGVDLGLTLHSMESSHVGVGLDLVYHYWPASPEYTAAYDRYLRGWLQTIDSPTWSFSAIQVSGHLKFIGPTIRGHAPWAQIGGGFYRVNRNLADPNWEGSVMTVLGGGPNRIVVVPGWYGSIGVDFRTSPTMVLGLNATYQRLSAESEPSVWGDEIAIPGFSAFTVGTQILFGK